jgi:hypothetical protein
MTVYTYLHITLEPQYMSNLRGEVGWASAITFAYARQYRIIGCFDILFISCERKTVVGG